MASQQEIENMQTKLRTVLKYHDEKMFNRQNVWGDQFNFEDTRTNLERVFGVLVTLQELPLEQLPDTEYNTLNQRLNEFTNALERIDKFTTTDSNPVKNRDGLAGTANKMSDDLYSHVAKWLPFLAYQDGKIDQHIQKLKESEQEAKDIFTHIKKSTEEVLASTETYANGKMRIIDAKMEEANGMMAAYRNEAIVAGTGAFTKDFEEEADNLNGNGRIWLIATAGFASVTFIMAFVFAFYLQPLSDVDTGGMVQQVGSKFMLLGVLLGTMLWCGRIYRSQMHQAATNKHRALSSQTVQAFHHAAADPAVKDAVVLEADTVFNFKPFSLNFRSYLASFSLGGSTPKPPRYLHKGDVILIIYFCGTG